MEAGIAKRRMMKSGDFTFREKRVARLRFESLGANIITTGPASGRTARSKWWIGAT